MGRRRCCCGCWTVTDDFTSSDSTKVPGWVEVSGDWEIQSNTLVEVDGAGLIYYDEEHPKAPPTGVAWVTIKNIQPNRMYFIFINYDEVTGQRDYARLETNATGGAFLTVGTAVAAASYAFDEEGIEFVYVEEEDVTLKVCHSETGLYGETSLGSAIAVSCPNTGASGTYGGVEGYGGQTEWDNFTYIEHWFTNHDCPDCECECEGYCMPDELLATFTADGDADCEASLDGFTVDLDILDRAPATWSGENTTPSGCRGGAGEVWDMELVCNGDDISEWYLWIKDETTASCIDHGWDGPVEFWSAYPSAIQCNPLELVFGPFWYTESEVGTVCTYYITVTVRV